MWSRCHDDLVVAEVRVSDIRVLLGEQLRQVSFKVETREAGRNIYHDDVVDEIVDRVQSLENRSVAISVRKLPKVCFGFGIVPRVSVDVNQIDIVLIQLKVLIRKASSSSSSLGSICGKLRP